MKSLTGPTRDEDSVSGGLAPYTATCMSEPLSWAHPEDSRNHSAGKQDHNAVYLPENVLAEIARRVRVRGTEQTPVLYLMAMHDTCMAWRRVTKALHNDTHLLFDGASYVCSSASTLEQRYKCLPLPERRQFLRLAAQRCSGADLAWKTRCLLSLCYLAKLASRLGNS